MGDDAEIMMAHATNNGSAQSISANDFNERVKRLLEKKPAVEPAQAKQAARRFSRSGPRT
ncbi:hypothetical protein DK389_04570 [Methylobacterium durans]|uniref:Uncharacterized protein n=2 Tax=Methylobacterium durans TaxID=2202825 RepID=A0A2U8W3U0_9HYPH|nr:hypothetical protein DK389_04570 [Methylobacterium durans]